jgi:hypothetical protein
MIIGKSGLWREEFPGSATIFSITCSVPVQEICRVCQVCAACSLNSLRCLDVQPLLEFGPSWSRDADSPSRLAPPNGSPYFIVSAVEATPLRSVRNPCRAQYGTTPCGGVLFRLSAGKQKKKEHFAGWCWRHPELFESAASASSAIPAPEREVIIVRDLAPFSLQNLPRFLAAPQSISYVGCSWFPSRELERTSDCGLAARTLTSLYGLVFRGRKGWGRTLIRL